MKYSAQLKLQGEVFKKTYKIIFKRLLFYKLMININGIEELEDFIWDSYENKKIIVIYFGAVWCGPCEKLKEKLNSDEAKEEMTNLSVCYVDIDEEDNEEINIKYEIKSLPTQVFISLQGDQIIENKRIIGYDWINFLTTYHKLNNKNPEEQGWE